ncbi:hypothetical protein HN011_004895 [Eciton burchellii]|nr:hypothetical protein HN011_004895 [Eciton burchellii]
MNLRSISVAVLYIISTFRPPIRLNSALLNAARYASSRDCYMIQKEATQRCTRIEKCSRARRASSTRPSWDSSIQDEIPLSCLFCLVRVTERRARVPITGGLRFAHLTSRIIPCTRQFCALRGGDSADPPDSSNSDNGVLRRGGASRVRALIHGGPRPESGPTWTTTTAIVTRW